MTPCSSSRFDAGLLRTVGATNSTGECCVETSSRNAAKTRRLGVYAPACAAPGGERGGEREPRVVDSGRLGVPLFTLSPWPLDARLTRGVARPRCHVVCGVWHPVLQRPGDARLVEVRLEAAAVGEALTAAALVRLKTIKDNTRGETRNTNEGKQPPCRAT